MTIKGMFCYCHANQRLIGSRTIPVAYIGFGNNHISFFYDTFFLTFFLIVAFSVKYQQCLFGIGMVMPEVTTAG